MVPDDMDFSPWKLLPQQIDFKSSQDLKIIFCKDFHNNLFNNEQFLSAGAPSKPFLELHVLFHGV